MIDIHNHILPGIDDGARTLNDSIEIIRCLEQKGYTDIILTPHYIEDSRYDCNNKKKKELLEELEKQIKKENININLYLGNEIFISSDTSSLIKAKKATTLNNSKYILVETSMYSEVKNLEDMLDELIKKGYIPVLAHPERYLGYTSNFDFFERLINKGIILQGNIKSLRGTYGETAKKMLTRLLKRNMIHLVATDSHHIIDVIELEKDLEALTKLVGQAKKEELTIINPKAILEDKILEKRRIEKEEKNLFERIYNQVVRGKRYE